MLRGPGRASDTRDPSAGAAELARVTRPDGAVLATVFSTTSHDPARDQIDAFAQDADWQIPAWYTQLKTTAVPILGSATAMASARSVVLADGRKVFAGSAVDGGPRP